MDRRFASSVVGCSVIVTALMFCQPRRAWSQNWPVRKLAPFVPSPKDVAEKMLRLADVGKDDVVYDLGAGDGRIVALAAKEFDATAVGIEIDDELCAKAAGRIKELKVEKRARIVCADLLTVDLSEATVVTMYLATMANAKVRPHLEKYLRKGARVVSHAFEIPGWTAAKVQRWKVEGSRQVLYLYVR